MQRYGRSYTVFIHCFVWSTLTAFVLLLGPRPPETRQMPWTSVQVIWTLVPLIGVFYAHAYWLMPVYLFRKRRKAYAGLLLLMILLSAALSGAAFYLHARPAGHTYLQGVERRILPSILLVLVSASLGAFRDNWRLEREKKEKETEHLRTELSFLRSQVNPHFMLNVLNSMVLMARKKSDMLEHALVELAGLMNYMLYETGNEKISLADEIEYLRVYIDLQLLRFGNDVKVVFRNPPAIEERFIEPMLLIPIVENAFKHGIGLVQEPMICIDIRIPQKDRLEVRVKNKFSRQIREEGKAAAGIGLINLKKRLELIYPGLYRMDIMTSHLSDARISESWYDLSLNIPLE